MSTLSTKLVAIALGIALAVAAAAPVMAETAKKTHQRVKHKAAAMEQPLYRGTDKFPKGPLYYNGNEYLGDDPDPNVRFQLWRDLGAHFGGESN
jgi:hypothetical protein